MAMVALYGICYLIAILLKEKKAELGFAWLVIFIFSIPTILLALRTERFAILLVVPFGFMTALGFYAIEQSLLNVRNIFLSHSPRIRIFEYVSRLLMICLFLPVPLVLGHIGAQGVSRIMNDVWYNSLLNLKEKSPPNAIIDSWWPPGYFINAVAERRTVIDGGTQQNHQTYWMARAFLSSDEKTAVGLFNMVNTKGNAPLDFLLERHWELSDAIELITDSMTLDPASLMAQLSGKMSADEQKAFVNLIQIEQPPPSYLFLYNDLMEKNLALTLLAKWNFRKAKEFQQKKQLTQKPIILALGNWVQNVLQTPFWTNPLLIPNHQINSQAPVTPQASQSSVPLEVGLSPTFLGGQAADRWLTTNLTRYEEVKEKKFQGYLSEVFDTIEGAWKYLPEAGIREQKENKILFENGVLLDMQTQSIWIQPPSGVGRIQPYSVFEVTDQKLVEHVFPQSQVSLSVLLFKRQGQLRAVVADPALIRSVLYQLYYLDGITLSLFKPVYQESDQKTTVKIFKINWEQIDHITEIEQGELDEKTT